MNKNSDLEKLNYLFLSFWRPIFAPVDFNCDVCDLTKNNVQFKSDGNNHTKLSTYVFIINDYDEYIKYE